MNCANSTNSTNDSDVDFVMKIVLVGESNVGKTNILSRYTKNEFSKNYNATIGVEFASATIRILDYKLRLQIWDTAGQERYKSITSSFYKNAIGAFVIFDITNKDSFEKVDYWISQLKQEAFRKKTTGYSCRE